MLNADSRDYKHICAQFGVEDTDLIVMKVEAKKRESEQNKCLVGESVWWLIACYGQHALLDTSLLVLPSLLVTFFTTSVPLWTWQDGVIPYNEEKTATLNQINAGRSAGLMSQTGESTAETERFQMNGDSDGHDGSFLPECKCRSQEHDCDSNAAHISTLVLKSSVKKVLGSMKNITTSQK